MTEGRATGVGDPQAAAGVPSTPQATTRPAPGSSAAADLRFAASLAGVLVVLGALLGLVWAWWSPAGPRALVVSPGVFEPDETEAFAAGDGRFLIIAVVVGLAAAIAMWQRKGRRGPLVALALVVGGLLGSLATAWVGHLTGGGTFDGKPNTIIDALPLSLHMPGLLLVAPTVAALVYGLLVAFAAHDDLGRPDTVRDALRTPEAMPDPAAEPVSAPAPDSVCAGDHPQYSWGYGNAPGPLQQRDLPPQ